MFASLFNAKRELLKSQPRLALGDRNLGRIKGRGGHVENAIDLAPHTSDDELLALDDKNIIRCVLQFVRCDFHLTAANLDHISTVADRGNHVRKCDVLVPVYGISQVLPVILEDDTRRHVEFTLFQIDFSVSEYNLLEQHKPCRTGICPRKQLVLSQSPSSSSPRPSSRSSGRCRPRARVAGRRWPH